MIIPNDMIAHIGKIFLGEYNIPVNGTDLKILDIGANIGGFSVWASYRWPGSQIYAYEPVFSNFDLLKENTKGITPQIELNNVAVSNSISTRTMYLGKHNCGEASFYKTNEQSDNTIEVETIDASSLPKADIIKIDTEGSEVTIIESILFNPAVYMLEYHSEDDLKKIDEMLLSIYNKIANPSNHPNRGTVKYISKNIPLFG
jgi:FkbM family methyltransferase